MKKRTITANMMELCMQICCMCMDCCAFLSNMFSITGADHCAV